MRIPMVLLIMGVASCGQVDWRERAMNEAQELVRAHMNDPSLQFSRLQYTGDEHSGQTCGYYTRKSPSGIETTRRFIVFIDGAGGQNPFINDADAPYPPNKQDFEPNWRSQCVALGYAG